jgi:hypothetical protein
MQVFRDFILMNLGRKGYMKSMFNSNFEPASLCSLSQHFPPQREHTVFITNVNAVKCTKQRYIPTPCGQNAEFLHVKAGGTRSYYGALNAYYTVSLIINM